MTHGSLFAGIGGFDLGFQKAGWKTVWQVEIDPFCRRVLEKRFHYAERFSDIRECGAKNLCPVDCITAESPARTSASRASARGSRASVQASFTSLRESCANFDPLGLCSKMFPDFSVRTKAETLRKSTAFSWSDADMGFQGVVSTASFSESPNAAVECSLSEVLEGHAPQRFFLSPVAATGILRRAAKRGRALPMRLRQALEALSSAVDAKGRTHLLLERSASDSTPAASTAKTLTKGTSLPLPSANGAAAIAMATRILRIHSGSPTDTTDDLRPRRRLRQPRRKPAQRWRRKRVKPSRKTTRRRF